MSKFNWKNGNLIEPAKVTIGSMTYNVTEPIYEGETPLSAENLNLMLNEIYNDMIIKILDDELIKTGQKLNGKDIYIKRIIIPSLPNASTQVYPHHIDNVDEIWMDLSNSYMKWQNGDTAPLNYIGNGTIVDIRNVNKTGFLIDTHSNDRTENSACIVLKCTLNS